MKYYLLFIFLLIVPYSYAQTPSTGASNNVKTERVVRLNLISFTPSIETELPITRKTTTSISLGFQPLFAGDVFDGVGDYFIPAIYVQYRYFYNLDKRHRKSRHINNNSGNYIALGFRTAYLYDLFQQVHPRNENFLSFLPVTWGIQRSYYDRLHLQTEIGLNFIRFAPEVAPVTPFIHLSIGIDLTK